MSDSPESCKTKTDTQQLADWLEQAGAAAVGGVRDRYRRIVNWLRMLDQLHQELARARNESSAMSHVIIEAGIRPGIDYPCRCEECREVCRRMAEAGYLDPIPVDQRWWERNPGHILPPSPPPQGKPKV